MAPPTHVENVTFVKHYTDDLFSFRITRPKDFLFNPGQFIMLGLEIDNKPLMRAYSITSQLYDDELEFYSIKIQDGPLTSVLQKIKPGDEVLLSDKPVGNLTIWDILPGERLFMFSTGTGLAPFASIIRDPDTFSRFEEVILTHTCRNVEDLQYGLELVESLKRDPLCGEEASKKLKHYTTTTREEYPNMGRITNLIENKKIFTDLNIRNLDSKTDRVMICGSVDMVRDLSTILENYGMKHSTRKSLEQYAYERAFVG